MAQPHRLEGNLGRESRLVAFISRDVPNATFLRLQGIRSVSFRHVPRKQMDPGLLAQAQNQDSGHGVPDFDMEFNLHLLEC